MDDKTISDLLFYEMPPMVTDVTVLLGTSAITAEIGRAGAAHYKRGLSRKFILSGGQPCYYPHMYEKLAASAHAQYCDPADFYSDACEADFMAEIMQENGVPQSAIVFMDKHSANTGENIINIQTTLKNFDTAAIITSAPHQRRAMATALFVMGDKAPDMVTYGVRPWGITRDNWAVSPLAGFIRQEALKVAPEQRGVTGNYVGQFCVPLSDEDMQAQAQRIMRHNMARKVHTRVKALTP